MDSLNQPPTDDNDVNLRQLCMSLASSYAKCTNFGQNTYEDAKLIADAFNAATSLHRSGYDAQKVFETLPEIMRAFNKVGLYHTIQLLDNIRRMK